MAIEKIDLGKNPIYFADCSYTQMSYAVTTKILNVFRTAVFDRCRQACDYFYHNALLACNHLLHKQLNFRFYLDSPNSITLVNTGATLRSFSQIIIRGWKKISKKTKSIRLPDFGSGQPITKLVMAAFSITSAILFFPPIACQAVRCFRKTHKQ